MSARRSWIIAATITCLSGCSLIAPPLTAPHLSVIGVQLLKSDLWHQELKVRMRVDNPNERALPVKGLQYVLSLDGQEFAHGESFASFIVPALGQADFDVSASVNMAGAMLKMLRQAGKPIDYRLTGHVSLAEGLLRTVPFDEEGKFRLQ